MRVYLCVFLCVQCRETFFGTSPEKRSLFQELHVYLSLYIFVVFCRFLSKLYASLFCCCSSVPDCRVLLMLRLMYAHPSNRRPHPTHIFLSLLFLLKVRSFNTHQKRGWSLRNTRRNLVSSTFHLSYKRIVDENINNKLTHPLILPMIPILPCAILHYFPMPPASIGPMRSVS